MQVPDDEAPYLSVVVPVPGRGDRVSAVQRFADAWISQAKQHDLASELIVVHAAGEALNQIPRRPAEPGCCCIRVIGIQPQLLASKQASRQLEERILVNAGIRRARGAFVLAATIDIVFSEELIKFLASRRLEHGRIYRVDRYDVERGPSFRDSVDEQLAFCREHAMRIHAREGTFPLTPEGLRRNADDDIASRSGTLNFGSGWSPPERYPVTGETFRWIHDDADILARVPDNGGILVLEVEPGPGLDPGAQRLQLLDEHSAPFAEWTLAGRTIAGVAVPPLPSAPRRFRVRVSGGGAPVLNDSRILNLAVFHCDWAKVAAPLGTRPSAMASLRTSPLIRRLLESLRRASPFSSLLNAPRISWRAARLLARRGTDVVQAGLEFHFGPGWYQLEDPGPQAFRWASKNAAVFLRMPKDTSTLAMLVEPGPAQDYRPFDLEIRHAGPSSELLATRHIHGLTYIEFPVPAAPGTIAALSFSPRQSGAPAGTDPRFLNFRVFACGAGARNFRRSTELPQTTVVAADSKPAAKDWARDQESQRRQIQEMGKPAFLHANACSDFILMSRDRWFDLCGFFEVDLDSTHLNSLLCYAAHHAGVQEEALPDPLRIYHVGEDTAPNPDQKSKAALAADFVWLVTQMRTLHAPVIFNTESWGLAGEKLEEEAPPTRTLQ